AIVPKTCTTCVCVKRTAYAVATVTPFITWKSRRPSWRSRRVAVGAAWIALGAGSVIRSGIGSVMVLRIPERPRGGQRGLTDLVPCGDKSAHDGDCTGGRWARPVDPHHLRPARVQRLHGHRLDGCGRDGVLDRLAVHSRGRAQLCEAQRRPRDVPRVALPVADPHVLVR